MTSNSKKIKAPKTWNRAECYKGAEEKYNKLLPKIREVARLHGYAIAVHGSQKRDFDLVAAPWVVDASDPEPLIKDIEFAVEGIVEKQHYATVQPLGRLSFTISIMGHLYIDISVMPKAIKMDLADFVPYHLTECSKALINGANCDCGLSTLLLNKYCIK